MKRRDFLNSGAKIGAGIMLASAVTHANEKRESAAKAAKTAKMQLSKTAESNYAKLFGESREVNASDKEFFENYANFAFDEVFAESKSLSLQTRLKCILGALIAVRGRDEFANILNAALKNGVSADEVKEIIYQATAYVGIGVTLDFLNIANRVLSSNGIAEKSLTRGTTTRQNRGEKGLATQRAIFGAAIDKGNEAAPAEVKHIRRFLSANCFGDYYTREGLDLKFRELLTFVILISFGGADSQAKSHAQGNLNIGNNRAFLIEVITALIPYIGYPRALNAIAALG